MKMKAIRFLALIVAVLTLLASLSACGGGRSAVDNDPEKAVSGDSKILVAYFSWSGHGQQMARWIAEETGGELFRIVPAEAYGEDFNSCADRAKKELDEGTRPTLSEHIDAETMVQYDVIYLGFPIWWYDLPMPVWTFLEEYDLSGKTIISFFSHNGSSSGANSLNRISELAKGATVLTDEALSISGNSVQSAESKVRNWAKGFEN